jgi:tRNA G46 methylase TrmB
MESKPREITTNQVGVHENLIELVEKYRQSAFQKPIAQHTKDAFESVLDWLDGYTGEVIIDACCGVGESSLALATQYPAARVIGIDKSSARLDKHLHYAKHANGKKSANDKKSAELPVNVRVFQADLNDFWRLFAEALEHHPWTIARQCLYYPNPYPKKSQVQKRWHASPAFASMLACSHTIEVRSNWLVYLQEFQQALRVYSIDSAIEAVSGSPITPFERKYSGSGQQCWQLYTLAAGDDKK